MPEELSLLCEALAVSPDDVTSLSREPLGDGAVAGFVMPDGAIAYVDTSGLPVAQETGLALEGVARVWAHPADPHLPALAPAAFGHAAEVLLRRLGIAADGMPEFVGYRPGRRAVLRVPLADGGHVWVKVVRPRRIARIAEVHEELRRHGLPVPAVRGWSPEGLLVLDGARGVAATDAEWTPDAFLDAVDVLRARLADAPLDGPARTSLAARLPWYADSLVRALPDRREQVTALAAACGAVLAVDAGAAATIHGDLHLGQLFLDGGEISGLIDVDTAGHGAPVDDEAVFIGHAVASALLTAEHGGDAGRVWALADAARARWSADERTSALIAVHLLGHALGAVSGGAAERAGILLDIARAVTEEPKRPLTPAFEVP